MIFYSIGKLFSGTIIYLVSGTSSTFSSESGLIYFLLGISGDSEFSGLIGTIVFVGSVGVLPSPSPSIDGFTVGCMFEGIMVVGVGVGIIIGPSSSSVYV